MKEFIEAKKKELSLRLYAYFGKVEEDTGNDAEQFEENCLDWLEQTINEASRANPEVPKIAEATRLVVVDHRGGEPIGRIIDTMPVKIETSFQDDNRTLKIFITKRNDSTRTI